MSNNCSLGFSPKCGFYLERYNQNRKNSEKLVVWERILNSGLWEGGSFIDFTTHIIALDKLLDVQRSMSQIYVDVLFGLER